MIKTKNLSESSSDIINVLGPCKLLFMFLKKKDNQDQILPF